MTRRQILCGIHLAAILALAAPGAVAGSQGKSKGPGKRLVNGVYTSPDGAFTLRVGDWMLPGSRVEEQQFGPGSQGIFVADDFGKVVAVIRTDNTQTALTLEKVAEDFTVGEMLRDKRFTTTDRGQELRLLGIIAGNSPVVTQVHEGGKKVEKKNDLYEAWSIFLHDDAIFRVTAGLTPLLGEADSVMFERVKLRLELVLGTLAIAERKP